MMRGKSLTLTELRTEYEREVVEPVSLTNQQRPLSFWEKLWDCGAVRKLLILILLAIIWQVYATRLNNPLMLPTFFDMSVALSQMFLSGELLAKIDASLRVLLLGYGGGIAVATILTILAIRSRLGTDLLETLTAMFNPLPAIALLPLALLWFGLGLPSIVFVLIHAVTWPIALNVYSGFTGVGSTLRMVGQNYGLSGLGFVGRILIPAAFPQILTGLKVGWAFAWRTLIASELVFGVNSGSGGLGWFIFEKKNQLEIASVFAGLFVVIVIGIIVENGLFKLIEDRTITRWGMKS
ncbi:MAG TPA: ABC transporter permease subunit [Bacillota bacterium]|nr:ABC transporter permease subunit [Bacillota bacterium]HOL11241.1 ABC transporter permease subunit [Bacillota bacterium]